MYRRLFSCFAVAGLLLSVQTAVADAKLRVKVSGATTRFKNSEVDYAIAAARCDRVRIAVKARGPARARIGRGPVFERAFRRFLDLESGQAIRVREYGPGRDRDHVFRCLPDDFPDYRFTRSGNGDVELFAASAFGGSFGPKYAIVFDDRGVPLWWKRSESTPVLDVKALPGGVISWSTWYGTGYGIDPRSREEHFRAGGHRFRVLQTVGTVTDGHDLQPTADGNYLLLSYRPRSGVDLSAYTGDADATVLDAVIQKLSPGGELLWEWSSQGHIGPAETGRWYGSPGAIGSDPYDLAHINSVQELRSGDYLVSLRHTDAVYRIDRASGEVVWKLGGTPRAESLEVVGDPFNGTGGQHDAREAPDGTITLFDNGTSLGRPPRAARYDVGGGQARLVDEQFDPGIPVSGCCGSARLVGDSWLIAWGGNREIGEYGPDGEPLFELTFSERDGFSYRANPIDGEVSKRTFRRGMDRMAPPRG